MVLPMKFVDKVVEYIEHNFSAGRNWELGTKKPLFQKSVCRKITQKTDKNRKVFFAHDV